MDFSSCLTSLRQRGGEWARKERLGEERLEAKILKG